MPFLGYFWPELSCLRKNKPKFGTIYGFKFLNLQTKISEFEPKTSASLQKRPLHPGALFLAKKCHFLTRTHNAAEKSKTPKEFYKTFARCGVLEDPYRQKGAPTGAPFWRNPLFLLKKRIFQRVRKYHFEKSG